MKYLLFLCTFFAGFLSCAMEKFIVDGGIEFVDDVTLTSKFFHNDVLVPGKTEYKRNHALCCLWLAFKERGIDLRDNTWIKNVIHEERGLSEEKKKKLSSGSLDMYDTASDFLDTFKDKKVLNDAGMPKELIASITLLKKLTHVNVPDACLPDGFIFSKLTNLEYLNLASLAASFPKHVPIYLPASLRVLNFSNNPERRIPEPLCHLKTLIFENNKLEELPSTFSQLRDLQTLNFKNNCFKYFPVLLVNHVGLQSIDLSHNQITKVTYLIHQLKKLKTLNLASNQLTELPVSIGQLSSLETLDISDNNIVVLPKEIADVPLKSFSANKNGIWELPEEFKKIKTLQSVALNNNELKAIPTQLIGSIGSLQFLYVASNRIKEVPFWLNNCTTLKSLDVDDNYVEKNKQLYTGFHVYMGKQKEPGLLSNRVGILSFSRYFY